MAPLLPWPRPWPPKLQFQLNKDRKSRSRMHLDAEQKHSHKYCCENELLFSCRHFPTRSPAAQMPRVHPAQGFALLLSPHSFPKDRLPFSPPPPMVPIISLHLLKSGEETSLPFSPAIQTLTQRPPSLCPSEAPFSFSPDASPSPSRSCGRCHSFFRTKLLTQLLRPA